MTAFSGRLRKITEHVFGGNAAQAALSVGLSPPAFHRLLTGAVENPRLSTVASMSEAFGLPLAYLVGAQSACDAQAGHVALPEPLWLLTTFFRRRQKGSRVELSAAVERMSAQDRRKFSHFQEYSKFSLNPLEAESPLNPTLGILLNRENPKKEEIALVRSLFEIETQALELAVRRLKELGYRG
jgi:hypothetical protein